jgi:hypothetical protein
MLIKDPVTSDPKRRVVRLIPRIVRGGMYGAFEFSAVIPFRSAYQAERRRAVVGFRIVGTVTDSTSTP